MGGYWNDPERTAETMSHDGWILTGDLGRVRDDGNIELCGRVTEMYIRGGYNVYPAEVERVLSEHPSVAQVALVGIPDRVLGEIGLAFVVPAGEARPDLDVLRAHCRAALADYKAPDRLEIIDALPLTSVGKVDKRALLGGR